MSVIRQQIQELKEELHPEGMKEWNSAIDKIEESAIELEAEKGAYAERLARAARLATTALSYIDALEKGDAGMAHIVRELLIEERKLANSGFSDEEPPKCLICGGTGLAPRLTRIREQEEALAAKPRRGDV